MQEWGGGGEGVIMSPREEYGIDVYVLDRSGKDSEAEVEPLVVIPLDVIVTDGDIDDGKVIEQ